MMISFNPVLVLVSIIISFIASYTALDLILLMKSADQKKRKALFINGSLALGIGIWAMHFIGLLAMDFDILVTYEIHMIVLSMIAGVIASGLAIFSVNRKQLSFVHLMGGSLFVTVAVILMHLIGMKAIHISFKYDFAILFISSLIIFTSWNFMLWILFYFRSSTQVQPVWLKPLSGVIIGGATVGTQYLLIHGSTLSYINDNKSVVIGSTEYMISYLLIIIATVTIGAILITRALLKKQEELHDTKLSDIMYALDASSIVAITDPKGKITFVNDKFCEISKYDREELIGEDHRILNSNYHPKEFIKDLWKTIGQGNVWKGEIRNKAKDGTIYWVDTTIVPFLNAKGKPYQYVSIRSDITSRKITEENLRNTVKELRDVNFALDQSSIVAITDQKGTITMVNDKFCEISKYTREELLGEDHKILNSGFHSTAFFKELWKVIGQGNVWKGEIRNKAKDGTYYWVDTTIVPFLNEKGKPYQYLAIRNDITERKKSEEMLHRSDKLSAIGELAAGVAHEIRNPLTSMRGYTEYLQLDEENESRKEYLDIILDEINRINTIVEEFMMLAKPKSVTFEEKNIIPTLKHALSLLEFEAKRKRVRLFLDCNLDIIQVECDENHLKQVFINLIKNAIEAMPNGGDIVVDVSILDGSVQISIKDNGVGIPQEKLKKIGEPFFTTKEDGNGLGLMVCFQIIEKHKGKIYVESEVNKGTTFNILLPTQTA